MTNGASKSTRSTRRRKTKDRMIIELPTEMVENTGRYRLSLSEKAAGLADQAELHGESESIFLAPTG